VVGSRDIGAGLKLTVWALDPDHCEVVLPGWPKTLANWTGDPDLGDLASSGAAVAIDENGNLAIGGNLIVDGETQPYVALLTSDGARLWEKTGSSGDELAGLAAFTGAYSNRLVGVGWRRTSKNPVRTDAMAWTYQAFGKSVTIASQSLKAPFSPDEQPDEFNGGASGPAPCSSRAAWRSSSVSGSSRTTREYLSSGLHGEVAPTGLHRAALDLLGGPRRQ
jgi:hypothetical protein